MGDQAKKRMAAESADSHHVSRTGSVVSGVKLGHYNGGHTNSTHNAGRTVLGLGGVSG